MFKFILVVLSYSKGSQQYISIRVNYLAYSVFRFYLKWFSRVWDALSRGCIIKKCLNASVNNPHTISNTIN